MPISGYGKESTQSAIGITEGSSDMDVEEYGASPNDETQEELVLSEVVSRREENVKHFDLGHGRFQAVAYGNAVHRKDENGVWQDIDNRLYPAKRPCRLIRNGRRQDDDFCIFPLLQSIDYTS